jgi:hypothetical protein
MLALTLTQPYATLIAVGVKTIETRSWGTPYRGELAIHAAKAWPADEREWQFSDRGFWAPLLRRLGLRSVSDFPRGVVVATCRLVDCVPTDRLARAALRDEERALGDFSGGRFAWMLADVAPLPEPAPARGSLGLWEWRDG